MIPADALSRRSDHIPDDMPELERRIFTNGQIISAVNEILYKNESDILEGIREITPHDETVEAEVKEEVRSKKNKED